MKVCVSMEFSYYDSSSFLTGLPVGIMPCLLVSFVQETHTFPAFENFEKHDGNFVIPAVFLPVSRTGNLKFYIVWAFLIKMSCLAIRLGCCLAYI